MGLSIPSPPAVPANTGTALPSARVLSVDRIGGRASFGRDHFVEISSHGPSVPSELALDGVAASIKW
jgi:hypothetical protein